MNDQKAYEVLGLQVGADPSEVKSAWHKKCLENHPDKGGDKAVFIEVMKAYEWITDPSTRYKQIQAAGPDLNMQIQYLISFDEMFFGKEIVVAFNKVEIDSQQNVIRKNHEEIHTISIKLPAGFGAVHTVDIPDAGIQYGTRHGNCRITFKTNPHKRFNVDKGNVVCEEQLPLDVMIKGGKYEVETMYGKKKVKVPPGTQPGQPLEVKKAGVGRKGSHIILAIPKFPKQEELRNEEWKGLGINWEISEEDEQFEEDMLQLLGKLMGESQP